MKIMPLKADYGEIPISPIKMFPPTAFQQKECHERPFRPKSSVMLFLPSQLKMPPCTIAARNIATLFVVELLPIEIPQKCIFFRVFIL